MHLRLSRSLVPVLLALACTAGHSCGDDDTGDGPTDASTDDPVDAASDAEDDLSDEADEPDVVHLPAWPDGRYIEPEEVHLRLVNDDPDMLPLLVSDEEFWDMGMIEGSVVVPWDLLSGRLDEVDASRYVVVYCRRGVRSESAFDTLETAGYAHIWVMSGGLEEWIDVLGHPVVDVP
jgi:rhodanese-related sulfurtransferase